MSALSFAALRAANLTRCARWHPRGLSEWSLSDWFTATMGELGEAANVAKKLNRVRDGIAGNTISEAQLRSDLADEIADVAIYLDILAASEGINLATAIASKFNRTSEKVGFPDRLPEGLRCEHCGVLDDTQTKGCAPPFTVQPHAFTGNHPADRSEVERNFVECDECHQTHDRRRRCPTKLQIARAEDYTEELRRTGRIA